ncbi:PRP38-domain-containing protein [Polyplosphaeria fusca]|uniref:Pre-mRNA-splicing factor 38 n=1 Tax=Polyplosphaeria fusca TaxID=682080 RepID=A0A9P4V5B7_9PLEO|nr:PRP38-domain-containing protein [Polyplosphaeria fusca]
MPKEERNHHRADAQGLLDDRGYTGKLVRGQNPAHLFEEGVRHRIINSYYWKEQCFGLNAATLCDRAVRLTFIGGTSGLMGKPTPFLCLAFKLMQLLPPKKIILEYLNFSTDSLEYYSDDENPKTEPADDDDEATSRNPIQDPNAQGKVGEFKYLRALAAFYIRLAWEPKEIYETLEPLLLDSRKIKRRTQDGFTLTYMDQFIDDLLTKDRACATSLWKMPRRSDLEDREVYEVDGNGKRRERDHADSGSDYDGRRRRANSDSDDGRRRSYSDSEDERHGGYSARRRRSDSYSEYERRGKGHEEDDRRRTCSDSSDQGHRSGSHRDKDG